MTAKTKRTAAEITALVSAELQTFRDQTLRQGFSRCLVTPSSHFRVWDWSTPLEKYECWMIAQSQNYDYGIVYSDYGFGPKSPWGLVFLSKDNFGADYSWYSHLEDAFADSRLTDELELKRNV